MFWGVVCCELWVVQLCYLFYTVLQAWICEFLISRQSKRWICRKYTVHTFCNVWNFIHACQTWMCLLQYFKYNLWISSCCELRLHILGCDMPEIYNLKVHCFENLRSYITMESEADTCYRDVAILYSSVSLPEQDWIKSMNFWYVCMSSFVNCCRKRRSSEFADATCWKFIKQHPTKWVF